MKKTKKFDLQKTERTSILIMLLASFTYTVAK